MLIIIFQNKKCLLHNEKLKIETSLLFNLYKELNYILKA